MSPRGQFFMSPDTCKQPDAFSGVSRALRLPVRGSAHRPGPGARKVSATQSRGLADYPVQGVCVRGQQV